MTAKYVKILLACFYLLQVFVIFRESIVKLYERAAETVHREAESPPPRPVETRALQGTARLPADPTSRFWLQPADAAAIPAVIAAQHKNEEPHPHEPQKKDRARRQRQMLAALRFYANLFPRYRQIVSTGVSAVVNIVYPQPRHALAA